MNNVPVHPDQIGMWIFTAWALVLFFIGVGVCIERLIRRMKGDK